MGVGVVHLNENFKITKVFEKTEQVMRELNIAYQRVQKFSHSIFKWTTSAIVM